MSAVLSHNELAATIGSYLPMVSLSLLFSLVLVPIVNLMGIKYIKGNVLDKSLLQHVTQMILMIKPICLIIITWAPLVYILWVFFTSHLLVLRDLNGVKALLYKEYHLVLAYLYQFSGLNNETLLETVLSSSSNNPLVDLVLFIEVISIFVLPYLQVIQMNSSSPFKNTSLTQIYKYTPAVITCGVFVYNTVVYILLDQSLIRNIFIATVSFIFYVDPSLIALEFI